MYSIADQASPGFKVIAREPRPYGNKSMGLPITNIVFIIRVVFIINPHHKGLLSRTAIASPKLNKTRQTSCEGKTPNPKQNRQARDTNPAAASGVWAAQPGGWRPARRAPRGRRRASSSGAGRGPWGTAAPRARSPCEDETEEGQLRRTPTEARQQGAKPGSGITWSSSPAMWCWASRAV